MSDAFGGILDSMRGVVTDTNSFFDHAMGSAVARGIAGGSKPQNDVSKLFQANSLSKMNNVPDNVRYSPASDSKFKEAQSVNFENVEQSWLTRLRRFSQIDSELTAGRVNEGKPQ